MAFVTTMPRSISKMCFLCNLFGATSAVASAACTDRTSAAAGCVSLCRCCRSPSLTSCHQSADRAAREHRTRDLANSEWAKRAAVVVSNACTTLKESTMGITCLVAVARVARFCDFLCTLRMPDGIMQGLCRGVLRPVAACASKCCCVPCPAYSAAPA